MNFDPKVQLEILREISGLENAELLLPGYGVAYDHVDPRQLHSDLSVIKLPGLYLAVSFVFISSGKWVCVLCTKLLIGLSLIG